VNAQSPHKQRRRERTTREGARLWNEEGEWLGPRDVRTFIAMNPGMVAGYVLILVIITPFVIVGVSWFLVLVAPIGAAATLLICYLWVAKGAQSPHKHRAGEGTTSDEAPRWNKETGQWQGPRDLRTYMAMNRRRGRVLFRLHRHLRAHRYRPLFVCCRPLLVSRLRRPDRCGGNTAHLLPLRQGLAHRRLSVVRPKSQATR
jgi:hypothetical protein